MIALSSLSRCSLIGLASRGLPPMRKSCMSASAAPPVPPVPLADAALFRQQGYIDGAWCDANDGASLAVLDPATGRTIGSVADMGAAETRRAIAAAEAAWPEWRSRTGKERAAVLRAWFDLITEHREDLAALMTAECGKPLAESRGEVPCAFVRFRCARSLAQAAFLITYIHACKRTCMQPLRARACRWRTPLPSSSGSARRPSGSTVTTSSGGSGSGGGGGGSGSGGGYSGSSSSSPSL